MLLECNGKSVRDRLIAKDSQWHTPLHMACSRSNVPAVQELLKYIQGMFMLKCLLLCVELYCVDLGF